MPHSLQAMPPAPRCNPSRQPTPPRVPPLPLPRRWFDKGKRDTLKLLLVQITCRAGDSRTALQHVKYTCNRWPYSWSVWNQYCQIYNATGSIKHWIKFVISQRSRNITSLPLIMLQGHVLSANRSYRQALQEYLLVRACGCRPDDQVCAQPRSWAVQLEACLWYLMLSACNGPSTHLSSSAAQCAC
jgi:hypothetical protein